MKYWKEIVICVLTLVVIALIMSTTCSKRKLDIAENNVKALIDSVRTYQLENGELLSAKQLLILENKQLEEYLDISKKEKKEIEKKLKSSIAYIAKLEASVRIDTLRLTDSVYVKNGNLNIDFNYDDEYVRLDGSTILQDSASAYTTLNRLEVDVPLKVGISEDNQFFISSKNPYILISDIEGAQLITNKTKQKRWGIGPYLGIGLGYGEMINKNGFNNGFFLGGTIGIAIHYDLFQW